MRVVRLNSRRWAVVDSLGHVVRSFGRRGKASACRMADALNRHRAGVRANDRNEVAFLQLGQAWLRQRADEVGAKAGLTVKARDFDLVCKPNAAELLVQRTTWEAVHGIRMASNRRHHHSLKPLTFAQLGVSEEAALRLATEFAGVK